MIRGSWLLIPVVIIALLVGGGLGAAVADHHDRVVQLTTPSGEQPVQIVRVDDGGRWHHRGFFPFGFLLFPLLWIGLIFLFWGGFWRRRGPGWGRWDDRFEEWHRRQHGANGAGGQSSPPGASSA
jgi:hypothetical protein